MTARFGTEAWSLVVPDGWRAWHDEGCATLVAADEIGALQISAAFKDDEVLDADLRDFASEHLASGVRAQPSRAGDFVGFEIAFSDSERFWRHWYLRHGKQMLYVTYNCNIQSRGVETTFVEAALSTLAATPPGH